MSAVQGRGLRGARRRRTHCAGQDHGAGHGQVEGMHRRVHRCSGQGRHGELQRDCAGGRGARPAGPDGIPAEREPVHRRTGRPEENGGRFRRGRKGGGTGGRRRRRRRRRRVRGGGTGGRCCRCAAAQRQAAERDIPRDEYPALPGKLPGAQARPCRGCRRARVADAARGAYARL